MVFGDVGFLLGAREDVGVGDGAAGCGDHVKGFGCCAKTVAAAFGAMFFAEGTQSRAGEEFVVVDFGG